MVKRSQRKKKISRLRAGALGFGMLMIAGAFVTAAFQDVLTYYNLNMEIKANTELLEKTKAEQEQLETTKKNLTNPDYLEFVARGRYHVSKSGEQVFVFPALSQAENTGPVSEQAAAPAPIQDSEPSQAPSEEPADPQASEAETTVLPAEPDQQPDSEAVQQAAQPAEASSEDQAAAQPVE